MCLLRWWKTGFLVNAMTDLLSTRIKVFSFFFLVISLINSWSHMACLAASIAAINSASQDERATVSCFWEHYVMGVSPKQNKCPVVLFPSSESVLWLLSLYPTRFCDPSFSNTNPNPIVLCRYLKTCFKAFPCDSCGECMCLLSIPTGKDRLGLVCKRYLDSQSFVYR